MIPNTTNTTSRKRQMPFTSDTIASPFASNPTTNLQSLAESLASFSDGIQTITKEILDLTNVEQLDIQVKRNQGKARGSTSNPATNMQKSQHMQIRSSSQRRNHEIIAGEFLDIQKHRLMNVEKQLVQIADVALGTTTTTTTGETVVETDLHRKDNGIDPMPMVDLAGLCRSAQFLNAKRLIRIEEVLSRYGYPPPLNRNQSSSSLSTSTSSFPSCAIGPEERQIVNEKDGPVQKGSSDSSVYRTGSNPHNDIPNKAVLRDSSHHLPQTLQNSAVAVPMHSLVGQPLERLSEVDCETDATTTTDGGSMVSTPGSFLTSPPSVPGGSRNNNGNGTMKDSVVSEPSTPDTPTIDGLKLSISTANILRESINFDKNLTSDLALVANAVDSNVDKKKEELEQISDVETESTENSKKDIGQTITSAITPPISPCATNEIIARKIVRSECIGDTQEMEKNEIGVHRDYQLITEMNETNLDHDGSTMMDTIISQDYTLLHESMDEGLDNEDDDDQNDTIDSQDVMSIASTVISERKRQNLMMKTSFHKPGKVEEEGGSMKNSKNITHYPEDVLDEQEGANSKHTFDTTGQGSFLIMKDKEVAEGTEEANVSVQNNSLSTSVGSHQKSVCGTKSGTVITDIEPVPDKVCSSYAETQACNKSHDNPKDASDAIYSPSSISSSDNRRDTENNVTTQNGEYAQHSSEASDRVDYKEKQQTPEENNGSKVNVSASPKLEMIASPPQVASTPSRISECNTSSGEIINLETASLINEEARSVDAQSKVEKSIEGGVPTPNKRTLGSETKNLCDRRNLSFDLPQFYSPTPDGLDKRLAGNESDNNMLITPVLEQFQVQLFNGGSDCKVTPIEADVLSSFQSPIAKTKSPAALVDCYQSPFETMEEDENILKENIHFQVHNEHPCKNEPKEHSLASETCENRDEQEGSGHEEGKAFPLEKYSVSDERNLQDKERLVLRVSPSTREAEGSRHAIKNRDSVIHFGDSVQHSPCEKQFKSPKRYPKTPVMKKAENKNHQQSYDLNRYNSPIQYLLDQNESESPSKTLNHVIMKQGKSDTQEQNDSAMQFESRVEKIVVENESTKQYPKTPIMKLPLRINDSNDYESNSEPSTEKGALAINEYSVSEFFPNAEDTSTMNIHISNVPKINRSSDNQTRLKLRDSTKENTIRDDTEKNHNESKVYSSEAGTVERSSLSRTPLTAAWIEKHMPNEKDRLFGVLSGSKQTISSSPRQISFQSAKKLFSPVDKSKTIQYNESKGDGVSFENALSFDHKTYKKHITRLTKEEYDAAPRVVKMQVTFEEINQAADIISEWIFHEKYNNNSPKLFLEEEDAHFILQEIFDTRKTKSVLMSLCHFRRIVMQLSSSTGKSKQFLIPKNC